jgi:hypothetical protein
VRQLAQWADDDPGRVRRAIRSATLAANRALASTKRKTRPLSPKEVNEMVRVAEIYRKAAHALSAKLARLKPRGPADRR